MTKLDPQTIKNIAQYNEEQRYNYFLKTAAKNREIWILTDNDGCMMLNTQDEDCVPVWPHQELAQQWATGEWQDSQAKSIDLDKWFNDWTPGLLDDDLCLVVFPKQENGQEEGLVVFADELDYELKNQLSKRR